jgi:hypothetical protein
MSSGPEVLAALDDPVALKDAIARLPSIRALIPLLVSAAPAGASLPVPPLGHFEPRDALRLGRAGLWLATDLLREKLPRIRSVPSPEHERWDTLVELNRERPEAVWLVGALLAEMAEGQERLASRTLLGIERRFGEAGWEAIELAVIGAPAEGVVRKANAERGCRGRHPTTSASSR